MRWRPNVFWSLGWDPGHHGEVQNGPENKIHIREVNFWGSEKVQDFPVKDREGSRRFQRDP
jgi:hypothetical protein